MRLSRHTRRGSRRTERKEIFRWKILAKGQAVGGVGGEEEQLGITQAEAQADYQEDQTL
jgi:hypothetical protein